MTSGIAEEWRGGIATNADDRRSVDGIPRKHVAARFAMGRVKPTTGYRIPEPVET
jgi:hypothetical protein